ncbi:hypothetical protein ACOSP7_009136 [Xanthoceras sorbifolium]
MSALPLDLIVEILYRLPVKSLRFRCLSKEFCSMIDDLDFVRRHDNACLETTSNRRIIAKTNTTSISRTWGREFTIIGSCCGLLAMSMGSHGPHEGYITVFGFGYDVASDDYKLVRIIGNQSSTELVTIFGQVHRPSTKFTVYSLRANSWSWIEDLPDDCSFYSFHQSSGTLVAVTLNWMESIESRKSTDLIISFDLKSEKFRNVWVHDKTTTEVGKWDTVLNVLGGCLCLSCNHYHKKVFDIWVMKEYGVKDSWTKLFSFSYLCINFDVHRLRTARSLVYSKTGICHDLKKEKDEMVEVHKWPTIIYIATIYVDSLVLFTWIVLFPSNIYCFSEYFFLLL